MKQLEKAIKAAYKYDAALDKAFKETGLRHVPNAAAFKAKAKLRKTLEKLPHEIFLTLCEANGLTQKCHLMDKKSIIEAVLKRFDIPAILEKTVNIYKEFTE